MHGTLIQIHYHNRPGGVTTVMCEYARAFASACGASVCKNKVICHDYPQENLFTKDIEIVDVKACDYTVIASRVLFEKKRRQLVAVIISVVNNAVCDGPVYVIGHNMNMGKNCALTSAFSQLTKEFPHVRCLSVVHDFAEESRIALLKQISAVEAFYPNIRNEKYPLSTNLAYIAINAHHALLMKKAGMPVMLLENPLPIDSASHSAKKTIHATFQKIMRTQVNKGENTFDYHRPTVLYPSRVIARKNPVEAILIASVFYNVNLLFGAVGTSAVDRKMLTQLKRICKQHALPVVFDAMEILKRCCRHATFTDLYDCADFCMSTSVAEGFGYALHEPAQYGKNLVARMPDSFPASLRKGQLIYKRFFVPIEWVDVPRIQKQYYDCMKIISANSKSVPSYRNFTREFDKMYIVKKGIDFACLDISSQIGILDRCVKFPEDCSFFKQRFPAQTRLLMKYCRKAMTASVHCLNKDDSSDTFAEHFARCLSMKIMLRKRRINQAEITKHFAHLKNIHLLLCGIE